MRLRTRNSSTVSTATPSGIVGSIKAPYSINEKPGNRLAGCDAAAGGDLAANSRFRESPERASPRRLAQSYHYMPEFVATVKDEQNETETYATNQVTAPRRCRAAASCWYRAMPLG